jgi:hypothetical protein
MPFIVPTEGSSKKKSKSKRFQMNHSGPDPIDCHWIRDVVQETLDHVVEEESTDDRIVKIETVTQRVVYRRSCQTTTPSKVNISNMISTRQSFIPSSTKRILPINLDSETNTEYGNKQNEPPTDDASVQVSETTDVTRHTNKSIKYLISSHPRFLNKANKRTNPKPTQSLIEKFHEPSQSPTEGGIKKQVSVQIKTDNWPHETSWEVTDASSAVVMSGGGYTNSNKLYSMITFLSVGSYQFKIKDSYGDGI